EAAGVIDRATADRLRAADADLASGSHEPEDVRPTDPIRSAASRTFGPSVSVAEVFTYLGAGFVLAAWSAFSARTAGTGGDPGIVLGITSLLAAGVLVAIGRLLDR